MPGKLYVVSTPIGNLSDLSERAKEVLSGVDFIAAEDTRVTLKLLTRFKISKPMVSYFEHNRIKRGNEILEKILSGLSCALVSDAGTPAISDPGEGLVALCAENGVQIIPVPGPAAFVTALSASGLPSGRFCFEGFLSVNKKNRLKHLSDIKEEKRTMIFYEAPHKLKATLRDLLGTLGDRRVAIARELTKIHEEFLRTTLKEAVSYFKENDPRGEFVIILEGAQDIKNESLSETVFETSLNKAKEYVESGLNKSAAAKKAAAETGVSKNAIYKELLKINGEGPNQ